MSDKNGIEIDYCPNCRGIWLDRGELDKIIERSASHVSKDEHYGRDDDYKPGYRRDNTEHHKKPYKQKDSFFGDLFDF